MKTQSSKQSRLQAVVLRGYGDVHPDPSTANEVRYIRWMCRKFARQKQPTLRFDIPIYKP